MASSHSTSSSFTPADYLRHRKSGQQNGPGDELKAQLFEAFPDDPPPADTKWSKSFDRAAVQQLVLQRPAVRVPLTDLRSLAPSHFVQESAKDEFALRAAESALCRLFSSVSDAAGPDARDPLALVEAVYPADAPSSAYDNLLRMNRDSVREALLFYAYSLPSQEIREIVTGERTFSSFRDHQVDLKVFPSLTIGFGSGLMLCKAFVHKDRVAEDHYTLPRSQVQPLCVIKLKRDKLAAFIMGSVMGSASSRPVVNGLGSASATPPTPHQPSASVFASAPNQNTSALQPTLAAQNFQQSTGSGLHVHPNGHFSMQTASSAMGGYLGHGFSQPQAAFVPQPGASSAQPAALANGSASGSSTAKKSRSGSRPLPHLPNQVTHSGSAGSQAFNPADHIDRKPVPAGGGAFRDENCTICTFGLAEGGMYDDDDDGASVNGAAAPVARSLAMIRGCGHHFHHTCMQEYLTKITTHIQCPQCKNIYGTKIGTQPLNGTMTDSVIGQALPGFPSRTRTICITYDIRPGVQGPEHPSPGQPYRCPAFPRVAYLPDNEEGRRVLRLLRRAFAQRLTFTVGTSVTSGAKNVVTWNDIHHKTYMVPGEHGYPDPNYLPSVQVDLATHGITEE